MSDLKDIYDKIKNDTQETLENKVADKIKENIKTNAKEVVYDHYVSKSNMYKRRYTLNDKKRMKVKKYGDVGIEIVHNSPHVENVEHAIGYIFNEKEGFPNPPYTYQDKRPFMKKTKEDIKNNGDVNRILKNELKKKGYDIK